MSRLRANQITNENANGAPNFPHGLTVTGIITATTTSQTLPQIIVGSVVTANSNGVDTVGIVTAGTFKDKAGGTFAPNPTTTRGDVIVRGASVNERLAIGSAGQVLKVNAGANGLEYGTITSGTYSVHKIQGYSIPANQKVQYTGGRTDYIDIANGNYLTFTVTSTDDYIVFNWSIEVYCQNNNHGHDCYIMYHTTSSIGSGSTKLRYKGQHSVYGTWYHHNTSSSSWVTGLSAGTYYFELAGASHANNSNRIDFGHGNTNQGSDGNHYVVGVHYKKN